ncbi:MAG: sulfatase-like hydrolase/transferase [Candidatus Aminicenantes bacterium]|nr:sulfatase-like hydrolase/transferase [Candidatus Aminicenantes bacterium]
MRSTKMTAAVGWGVFFLFFAGAVSAPASEPVPPPAGGFNVLLITVDTLRSDRVSALSSRFVKTSNLDALAGKSLVFANAYAHSTLTRPSHANIMTGTTPLFHGVSDNPGFRLEKRYPVLAESLKTAGYATGAFIGAFILDSQFGLDRGFDFYDDMHGQSAIVERRAEQVVASAVDWISGRTDKWFAWIHLFDPHDPYDPPEPFKSQYAKDPYSGEVAYTDAQIGVLVESLEKRGLMDKTVIVLTSDHGEALGDKGEETHGFFAYNPVIRIPLFVYYPGVGNKTVAANVGHFDIFPTICSLTGAPVPESVQGESLLPIAGGRARKEPAIYFESLSPSFFLEAAPLQGFIEGKVKFIDLPIKEVYDVVADPGEENNLAPMTDLAPLRATLDRLRKQLKGKGTRQDLQGKDIRPLMESLGYLSGKSKTKKGYTQADDLKTLLPLIAQMHIAVNEFKAGKPDPALAKIRNITRIRPSYTTAYQAAAIICRDLGRLDKAEEFLRNGLEINPDNLLLLTDLGVTLIRAKKPAEASALLELVVERDEDNPEYQNYLGRAYMDLGELAKAEERFKKALSLDSDMVEAFNNLGYVNLIFYVQRKDPKRYEAAIANFDKALSHNPALASALKGKAAAAEAKAGR